jgi:ABC-type branched-subunit amino acid transport system substrate-binding protein
MIYEDLSALIDRPVAVALFKQLYQRNPREAQRLLPILLFLAPHGGGTSTFLNLLMKRGETAFPFASLDFAEAGAPTTLDEVLQHVSNQLSQSGGNHTRKLTFPRYNLGLSVVSDTLSDTDQDRLKKEIKNLVARSSLAEKIDDMVATTSNQSIVLALFFVLIKWSLPLLLHFLPDRAIRWYRLHRAALNLSPASDGIDVLLRLRSWSRSNSPKKRLLVVEQLLLAAFLDDVREAFDVTKKAGGRERTTHIVLFLKNFDVFLSRNVEEHFLSTLTKQRLEGKTDPLLVVVSSHRRLFDIADPAQNPPFWADDTLEKEQQADDYARTLSHHWQKSLVQGRPYLDQHMYIPLWLPDFRAEEVSSLLRMVDSGQTGIFEDRQLVERMHRLTCGHPLAVVLAARVFQEARLRGQEKTLNEFLPGPLPLDEEFASQETSVQDYLLHRFLQQLPEDEQEQLAFCAVPRFLDVNTLRVVLAPGSDTEAQALWNRYRHYTFARLASETAGHQIAFHPLLRDLLRQRLLSRSTSRKHYYKVAHTNLREYYEELAGQGEGQARVEAAYHALALGDAGPAIEHLCTVLTSQDDCAPRLLEAVAQAPTEFAPVNLLQRASEALYQAKQHRRMRDTVASLVLHTWLLNNRYIDVAQRRGVLYSLAESYRYLSEQHPAYQENAASFLDLARSQESRAQTDTVPVLPPGPDLTPFPTHRVSKFWQRARAIALSSILFALLISYPVVYYHSYASVVCNPTGFASVSTVLQSVYFSHDISAARAADGECIGLSYGAFAFDTTSNAESGSYKTQAAQALLNGDVNQAEADWDQANRADSSDAEALIYKENQHVLELSTSQHYPSVTIVILTTLTASEENQKSIASGRDDLQGAYVAQIEHNKNFRLPLLRLLIANTGGNLAYAPQVTAQIIRAIHQDPTIVGVMGPPQSRAEAIEAVKMLGQAHIPVVSSTASSDTFTNISPYFFRAAPPNKYQVTVGVHYAEQILHARNAVLFEALNDNYSQNLATDFREQFQQRDGHRILQTETYNAADANVSNIIQEKAGHACSYNPDLIYFTGRSDEMIRLLNSLNPCGKNNDVKIMGGDTLYQLTSAPNSGYPPYAYNRLYFTAFAYPNEWAQAGQAQFQPSFFNDYPQDFDPGQHYAAAPAYGHTLANSHVILAYDAMNTLLSAISAATLNALRTNTARFTPEDLRVALTHIQGQQALQGASGIIDFGRVQNGDPIDKVVVMLRVDEHGKTELVPNGVIGALRKAP